MRAIAALALLVTTLVAGTAPAAASSHRSSSSNGDDFRLPGRVDCTATDRTGSSWGITIDGGDTRRRAARVQYTLLGPDGRRGSIRMPIGTGRVSVLKVDIEYLGGGTTVASRPGMPWFRRHTCQPIDPGGPAGTIEIVYVIPPRKPTPAQIEAYCAEFAVENPDNQWESDRCVDSLMGHVTPPPV